jgi:hypothetical protein
MYEPAGTFGTLNQVEPRVRLPPEIKQEDMEDVNGRPESVQLVSLEENPDPHT